MSLRLETSRERALVAAQPALASFPFVALCVAVCLLVGCSPRRPVLYSSAPSTHAAVEGSSAGAEQETLAANAEADIDRCMELGAEQSAPFDFSAALTRMAVGSGAGAAIGGAAGAAGGRAFGGAGGGAAAGAAGAAVANAIGSLLEGLQPGRTEQAWVDSCLAERGHRVVGWR